jgi:hypothetical protein
LIRKKFPKQISFTIKIPAVGKGTTEITVTLNTTPHEISAAIQADGKIYVHAEIEVYLASITHSLLINDIFPAGKPIPKTSVPMKAVPPMPLVHAINPPLLIGVPRFDVRISKTTQTVLDGKRIQLNAEIDPGQIFVSLNFPGLLQVLVQKLTDAIDAGIQGVFGHSYLSDILTAVANFADLLLQDALEVLKLPDNLLSALQSSLASALQSSLLKLWSAREVPLFVLPRAVVIAPAVTSGPTTKAAVEVLISTIAAGSNVTAGPPPVLEFVGSMNLVTE